MLVQLQVVVGISTGFSRLEDDISSARLRFCLCSSDSSAEILQQLARLSGSLADNSRQIDALLVAPPR